MIPKILHQIWVGDLPEQFSRLSETWKHDYPAWHYLFWNEERIDRFVHEQYPQYEPLFRRLPYDVQRWDAIRYLILYRMGGMYVDFDYESIRPLDGLLATKSCCFAQEPLLHYQLAKRTYIFNCSLMAAVPGHPFVKKIIEEVFSEKTVNRPFPAGSNKEYVFDTTGQWMLSRLYDGLPQRERDEVYLIPASYLSPYNVPQARAVREGRMDRQLADCLQEAYAIHYYWGTWL